MVAGGGEVIRLRHIKLTKNPFDDRAHRRVITAALDVTAKGVLADFERTTATWNTKPGFDISDDGEFGRVIGTDDENYQRVDEGTRPHVIVARGKALAFAPGGSAKSRPRVIGSGSGGKGSGVVFTKRVNHPGTDGRAFADTIGEKWEPLLASEMEQRLGAVG